MPEIRLARPADNAGLLSLLRQVGIVTPNEAYRLEREPDAFAFNQYLGEQVKLLVAADSEDRILGMLSVSQIQAWLDDEPASIVYTSDLRVLPSAQGLGLGKRLMLAAPEFGRDASGKALPFFTTVARDNPVGRRMNAYYAEAGQMSMNLCGEVRPCFWPTLAGSLVRPSKRIRPATRADYPAMANLWQSAGQHRQLARRYDSWDRAPMPPLNPQDWLLAWQGEELQGFVGVWDQRSLRQVRLQHASPLLRLLGGHPNRALPLAHCLHLCLLPQARRRLPELLFAALRLAHARGLGILSLTFDVQDPLLAFLPPVLQRLGTYGRLDLISSRPPRRNRPFQVEMSLG